MLIEYSKNINFFLPLSECGKKKHLIFIKNFNNSIIHIRIIIIVSLGKKDYCGALVGQLAVIAVEPAGKTSFVYSCMQAKLLGQNDGK